MRRCQCDSDPNVPDVLRRARDLVGPAVVDAVGAALAGGEAARRVPPRPARDQHGRPATGGAAVGGKGIRPALAVLSAEAVGAPAQAGVPGAVAVELVHNFSLLHDDVIDCDQERRHRPTVWVLFGVGRAIIAGDALLSLAQHVVLASGGHAEHARNAALSLADATTDMIAGQALDMAFESLAGVDVERCLTMEAGKTGALLGSRPRSVPSWPGLPGPR